MINKLISEIFSVLLGLMFLSACSQNLTETFGRGIVMAPSETAKNAKGLPKSVRPAFAQFQDIPIPEGASMNMDRSLILGEDNAWIGRLVIESTSSKAELFDFFKERTRQLGWREITSVRATVSVLSYSKGNRIMTITFQSGSVVGTTVSVTMSPQGMSGEVRPRN